ncbi:MAG: hypothetical protein ABIS17_17200 [Casimicrobiaceae bacterium]
MNSINYGGLVFTNPVPVAYALPPTDPGIFAIQVRSLSYGPMPYQPIAFGASDNLAAVVFETDPAFERWQAHRLAGGGLFVSYCMLRYQSESYRDSMLAELAAQYLPGGGALTRPLEPARPALRDVE